MIFLGPERSRSRKHAHNATTCECGRRFDGRLHTYEGHIEFGAKAAYCGGGGGVAGDGDYPAAPFSEMPRDGSGPFGHIFPALLSVGAMGVVGVIYIPLVGQQSDCFPNYGEAAGPGVEKTYHLRKYI